jgi:diadenylate cyclase
MALADYVAIPMVVDVSATHKAEALEELVSVTCKTLGVRRQKQILDEVLKREESASTYVGQSVALPHARVPLETDFAIAVGRNPAGVAWDAARGAGAKIVVLLLTNENVEHGRHLQMLADIAALFRHAHVRQAALSSEGPVSVASLLTAPVKPPAEHPRRAARAPADSVVAAACRLARQIKAKHLIAFADAVANDDFVQQADGGADLVVVCSNKTRFTDHGKRIRSVIYTPPFPASRLDQMKIGILLALSRGLLTRADKVVCISGSPKKGVFDTIVVLDIATEYDFFYTSAQNILPVDVKPEVLERVLGVAAEISMEGREGKPLGTIFVIGDTNSVNGYVRQLIINPFRGYSEG